MTTLEEINKELNSNYKKLNNSIWRQISHYQNLTEEFIEKYIININKCFNNNINN